MKSIDTLGHEPAVKSGKSELAQYLPSIALITAALVFAGLAIRNNLRQTTQAPAAVIPGVDASILLSGRNQFQGAANAPYTLVEFGDFECPPCKHTQPLVVEALKQYPGQIKLDFRELPLTQIHPHAEAAAIAAESGRPVGKYWTLHDDLYATDLGKPGAIAEVLTSAGVTLNTREAQVQLADDAELEKKLSVNSTPSFFLCRPDGSILRLQTLESLGANLGR